MESHQIGNKSAGINEFLITELTECWKWTSRRQKVCFCCSHTRAGLELNISVKIFSHSPKTKSFIVPKIFLKKSQKAETWQEKRFFSETDSVAFPCDSTCTFYPKPKEEYHSLKLKDNESLLLFMIKQTPLICSRKWAAQAPTRSDRSSSSRLTNPLSASQILTFTPLVFLICPGPRISPGSVDLCEK